MTNIDDLKRARAILTRYLTETVPAGQDWRTADPLVFLAWNKLNDRITGRPANKPANKEEAAK